MNKKNAVNLGMYLALTLLAILAIPILLAISIGVVADFGLVTLLVGMASVTGGIWLLKFLLEKLFHLHIRSWFHFLLWLFLTLLIGFMICSLGTGDLTFKEMFAWGAKGTVSIFGTFLILPLAWLIMLSGAFQKAPANRPAKNALQAEQHEIDELYEKAFTQNDFSALCELVNTFYEGENQKFFQKSPVQAAKVFEGAQRLVQLVEEGKEKKPELEDYYWLGLMYEIGFACPPDSIKAIEYYTKALSTKTCWDGDPENFKTLCKQVQTRLTNLQSPNQTPR